MRCSTKVAPVMGVDADTLVAGDGRISRQGQPWQRDVVA